MATLFVLCIPRENEASAESEHDGEEDNTPIKEDTEKTSDNAGKDDLKDIKVNWDASDSDYQSTVTSDTAAVAIAGNSTVPTENRGDKQDATEEHNNAGADMATEYFTLTLEEVYINYWTLC